MNVKVSKWGNSLAIRIPSAIARSIHLSEGEAVEMKEEGDKIVLTPRRARSYDLEEMLSQVSPDNLHKEIRSDRSGREEW